MKTAFILFGATAVGKTAALETVLRDAPHLAGRVELISADSRQVYRNLDIGTAKPLPGVREKMPHHLVDILDPHKRFDVGQFVHACDQLVPEIHARGRLPVITGGTAFYLKAYLYGLPRTPPASARVRTALRRRLENEGLEALRAELVSVDRESAVRIGENDAYRILRALEIYHATGQPRSAFSEPSRFRDNLDVTVIGLFREREELYTRINERIAAMFSAGLPAEVDRLYRAGYRPEDPGLRTIGYREFFEVAGPPPWSPDVLVEIRKRISRDTRHYARRQEIFFRRLSGIRWLDADDCGSLAVALEESVGGSVGVP